MITTMTTSYSTPDEFYRAQVALWGFEAISELLDLGWVIVFKPDKGWTWDLTNGSESARLHPSGDREANGS
jgi:hypothetical protein